MNILFTVIMAWLSAAPLFSKEIYYRSSCELVQAMKAGELSAVEVMKGHLDRIEKMNPLLNGLVQRLSREECLKQALQADQRRVEGLALGKPELVYIKFYRGWVSSYHDHFISRK